MKQPETTHALSVALKYKTDDNQYPFVRHIAGGITTFHLFDLKDLEIQDGCLKFNRIFNFLTF